MWCWDRAALGNEGSAFCLTCRVFQNFLWETAMPLPTPTSAERQWLLLWQSPCDTSFLHAPQNSYCLNYEIYFFTIWEPSLVQAAFFILGFSLNSASQSQHDGTPHVAAISVWLTADDSVKVWADVLKPRSSMWKFFWKLAESRKLSWNLMQPLAGGEQPLLPLDVMLLPVPFRLKLWALCAQWIGY